MSDYNSALPIRSEADVDQRVQVKLVDFTTPSQGQAVDVDGRAAVKPMGNDPSGTAKAMKVSELGAMAVDGVYSGTDNTEPASMGVILHDRHATPGMAQQTMPQTAVQNGTAISADVALHDHTGAAYGLNNPLAVQVVQSGAGAEVNNYKTDANVAAAAGANHDLTVAGTELLLKSVFASASGKMKVEVQVDPTGAAGFTTVAVGFNSTAMPNCEIVFAPVQVAVGGKVRIIRTNLDKSAMDVYSTIIGVQLI